MRSLLVGFVACLAVLVPSMSFAGEDAEKRCFRVHRLTGFSYIDGYHMVFSGRTSKENYLVEFRHSCRDINFANKVVASFEGQLTCAPFVETVRTENSICQIQHIQKVKGRDEAKMIAAANRKEREARAAERKAARAKAKDGS